MPSRRKSVTETFPAVLECLTDTNLPTENVAYSWSKDGVDVKSSLGVTVIESGALFLKSTLRGDSGVFQCTAKTFDSNGLVTYPGSKILLDVQCKRLSSDTHTINDIIVQLSCTVRIPIF